MNKWLIAILDNILDQIPMTFCEDLEKPENECAR